jgi:four helix bundle protein
MAYKDFTQMTVWQKAFALLIQIYQITKSFPADERFGLISDMRRAANSAVHNISEGFGRFEARDKSRFYKISRGSCYELISQLMAAKALGYTSSADEVESIIQGYRETINELDSLILSIERKKQ